MCGERWVVIVVVAVTVVQWELFVILELKRKINWDWRRIMRIKNKQFHRRHKEVVTYTRHWSHILASSHYFSFHSCQNLPTALLLLLVRLLVLSIFVYSFHLLITCSKYFADVSVHHSSPSVSVLIFSHIHRMYYG